MSAPDQPTRTVLRETATGKILKEIAKADIDGLLALGYKFPETFTATARDGSTIIYGAIWKPTNFDPQKKYPVIDQSYTGPHTYMFPRTFAARSTGVINHLLSLGLLLLRSMVWVQPTVQKHFIMFLQKHGEESR
jgi:Dipeptidyl aminopeptidases/acylaminoacyl-peptidases